MPALDDPETGQIAIWRTIIKCNPKLQSSENTFQVRPTGFEVVIFLHLPSVCNTCTLLERKATLVETSFTAHKRMKRGPYPEPKS